MYSLAEFPRRSLHVYICGFREGTTFTLTHKRCQWPVVSPAARIPCRKKVRIHKHVCRLDCTIALPTNTRFQPIIPIESSLKMAPLAATTTCSTNELFVFSGSPTTGAVASWSTGYPSATQNNDEGSQKMVELLAESMNEQRELARNGKCGASRRAAGNRRLGQTNFLSTVIQYVRRQLSCHSSMSIWKLS